MVFVIFLKKKAFPFVCFYCIIRKQILHNSCFQFILFNCIL